jgi:AcrR family transcriptional regulator
MTRRDRLRAEMFSQIKRTARALLATGGPSAMSVRAIAREIRITPAAIYRYHPSLHTLTVAVQDDILDELTACLEAVRARADHPAISFRDVARTFRHWALENPAEFWLLFAHPDRTCPSPRVREFIACLVAGSAGSRQVTVGAAWSRMYGLVATELSGHLDLAPATADALFEQALDDLSPRPVPAPRSP